MEHFNAFTGFAAVFASHGAVYVALLLKLVVFVLIVRLMNWKLGLAFWLLSNVVGSARLLLLVGKYCIGYPLYYLLDDSYYSSLVILVVWALHELHLIHLPGLCRYVVFWVSDRLQAVLDVTGAGPYLHEG